MDVQQRLQLAIENERSRLRDAIPDDLEGAVVALIGKIQHLPYVASMGADPDVLTGRLLIDAGSNLALALVLQAQTGAHVATTTDLDIKRWSDWFLSACDRLATAELVLMQSEVGALRLLCDGGSTFDAWPVSPTPIASLKEREDWDWWAAYSARQYPQLRELPEVSHERELRGDDAWRQIAQHHVARMDHQLCYPGSAELCGISLHRCREVLELLIFRALRLLRAGEPPSIVSRCELVSTIAAELGEKPDVIGNVIAAFTLDAGGADYHRAAPGVAAAPLVLAGDDRLVLSPHGLLAHPLLFLARELRRRDTQAYHNASHLREDAFRLDLTSLFGASRFVCSETRIRLRRKGGTLRTDIDFAVFDRKSGALGLFELKAQDPFARSAEELMRQQDNVLDANRQVAATLDWLNRQGADEILNRIDRGTAKRFRVRKVFSFVLGRYLVHFHDGPAPSPRAAWGTWPEVLRVVDERDDFAASQSPIATLFARLSAERGSRKVGTDAPSRSIELGPVLIAIHPSYAAYQQVAEGSD